VEKLPSFLAVALVSPRRLLAPFLLYFYTIEIYRVSGIAWDQASDRWANLCSSFFIIDIA
jgi:hypothetical protein